MPVSQEKERCWAVDFANGPDPEGSSHYHTEASARDDVKTRDREAYTAEQWPLKVRQLAAPCWTVRCDGDCEVTLDEEGEGTTYHAADKAEALSWVSAYDWVILDDGSVICADDELPDGAEVRPARDIPGQLTLEVGGGGDG